MWRVLEVKFGAPVERPPVVDEDVEDAEESDEEAGAPFGLEAHGDHDTGSEADDGHEDPGERPAALEDEADEEEDQQHPSSELEAEGQRCPLVHTLSGVRV